MTRGTRGLIVTLFAASGFSALVYQVVWMRMLTSVLGSTSSATAAVLSAFMGGLALGGWSVGRVVDRHARPLAVFAWLEAAIALTALGSPLLLETSAPVYRTLSLLWGDHVLLRAAVQFALSTACLVVPTFLMGATLPALVRAVVPSAHAGCGLAALYGANTLGAAAGAFAAGFFLIPLLGLRATIAFAAFLNVVNAVVAWTMASARDEHATVPPVSSDVIAAPADDRPWTGRAVLITTLVAGFAGLASEVAWTRILVFGLGSTTYAFATMLVTYLVGIAVGSFLAGRVLLHVRRPVGALAVIQVLVGVAGVISLVIYSYYAEQLGTAIFVASERSWTRGVFLDFAVAALALLPVTVLMGAAFPVAYAAYAAGRPAVGSVVGRLYAASTVGSIAGSLAAAFVLIPALGLQRTLLLLASASLMSAALVAAADRPGRAGAMRAALPLAAAVSVFGLPIVRPFHQVGPTERLLFYREGPMSTVSVVEDALRTRKLHIDKIAVAGTDPVLLTDQKSLAHLPMLLHPRATRALTVGFGSGGASWSFTRYGRLEHVDCVEIDPTVLEAAPYLEHSHHGVLGHPRFRLIAEDVRSHLLTTQSTYDIISTDCTDLRYKSNALLYTREYFELCLRRLNPGGIVAVWLPLGGLSTDALQVALATFMSVFPRTSVWYLNNVPAHYALLVGSAEEITFDAASVARQLGEPAVRADLAEIGLADRWKLFGSFVTDSAGSRRLAANARINTDDLPILEFMVPRTGFRGSITANLAALFDVRRPPLLAGVSASEAEEASRYWQAAGELGRGHGIFLRGNHDYRRAIAHYLAAAALNPADSNIRHLVARVEATEAAKAAELSALAASESADARARNDLGLLWLSRGEADRAIAEFQAAAALEPADWGAPFNLGLAYERRGDLRAAESAYRNAIARDEYVAAAHTNFGLVLLAQQRVPDAIAALQRAAELDPESADAAYNLGLAYQQAGQPEKAQRAYDEAIRRRPTHAAALTNRGTIALAQGRAQEARRAFEHAMDAEPSYAEAHYNLGLLLDQAGQTVAAAHAYETAIRFRPDYPEARNNLGILKDRAGDHAAAIAQYRAALHTHPEYAEARTNLALALTAAGRTAEATAEAERAVRLRPQGAEAYVSLGLASWRAGQRERAIAAFEKALAIEPSLDTVRDWLETLRRGR